jgi:16S RNA G1207 methylase RsmC
MTKIVIGPDDWHEVYKELEGEILKPSVYDDFIIGQMGDVNNMRILDYGCGPGIIGDVLENYNADVDIYDINKKILEIARKRIPNENIIESTSKIKKETYDFVLCNLVLCIVDDNQVYEILHDLYYALKNKGIAIIGFCNPKIFNIRETNLDLRNFTGDKYKDNHLYIKQKKEGGYYISEMHRPIEWYEASFIKAGFQLKKKLFTTPYTFKGRRRRISDFVVFKLIKVK